MSSFVRMIDSPKPPTENFMLEESTLIKQYEKYVTLLERFFPSEGAKALIEHFGERLVLCPAGLTIDEGGYPGALVDRALRIAQKSKQLVQAAELPVEPSSAVRAALVAELGRLGDLDAEGELYLVQTSDWHREKLGQNYKYNEFCSRTSVPHRTLFLLQHFGLQLTQEEWVAVLTFGGLHLPENAFYGNKKNDLIDLLQLAKHVANRKEVQ